MQWIENLFIIKTKTNPFLRKNEVLNNDDDGRPHGFISAWITSLQSWK